MQMQFFPTPNESHRERDRACGEEKNGRAWLIEFTRCLPTHVHPILTTPDSDRCPSGVSELAKRGATRARGEMMDEANRTVTVVDTFIDCRGSLTTDRGLRRYTIECTRLAPTETRSTSSCLSRNVISSLSVMEGKLNILVFHHHVTCPNAPCLPVCTLSSEKPNSKNARSKFRSFIRETNLLQANAIKYNVSRSSSTQIQLDLFTPVSLKTISACTKSRRTKKTRSSNAIRLSLQSSTKRPPGTTRRSYQRHETPAYTSYSQIVICTHFPRRERRKDLEQATTLLRDSNFEDISESCT
jgi:hypothetical protein